MTIRPGDTVFYGAENEPKKGIAAAVGVKSVRLEGLKKRIPMEKIIGYEKPKKSALHKNPRSGGSADEHAARELDIYIDNTQALENQRVSIIKNLLLKKRKGQYDPDKAVKLWGYLVTNGAKLYAKEFSSGSDWSRIFTPATRRLTAQALEIHYSAAMDGGEYDHLLPVKATRLKKNPKSYPNIEKSGFARGLYIGYGGGGVFRIKRAGKQWNALENKKPFRRFIADDLQSLSDALAALDMKKNPRAPQTEYGYRIFFKVDNKRWYLKKLDGYKATVTDDVHKAMVIGTASESQLIGKKLAGSYPTRTWFLTGP